MSVAQADFPVGEVTVARETYSFETKAGETIRGTVDLAAPTASPTEAAPISTPGAATPSPTLPPSEASPGPGVTSPTPGAPSPQPAAPSAGPSLAPPSPGAALLGVVSTLAGNGTSGFADGPGAESKFNDLRGVAVDASGNVYVAGSGRIRVIR
ncbi:MAG: hypothetical protein VKS61_00705 [Candidatus Sericytochromatia bacterium]|nr:hypothetical protein [Candidatus Sericytochromatia bacterium]